MEFEIDAKKNGEDALAAPFVDYRDFLKTKFLEKKRGRPSYSIGVLARRLGCSESFIKKLFARKLHLGFRYAETILAELSLADAERDLILLHVIYHSVEGEKSREIMSHMIDLYAKKEAPFHLKALR